VTEEMSGGQHRTMKRKRAELQKRVEANEQRCPVYECFGANVDVCDRKTKTLLNKGLTGPPSLETLSTAIERSTLPSMDTSAAQVQITLL